MDTVVKDTQKNTSVETRGRIQRTLRRRGAEKTLIIQKY